MSDKMHGSLGGGIPPPAKFPEDCSVGPTEDELSDPSSFVFWGHSASREAVASEPNCTSSTGTDAYKETERSSKKRKHKETSIDSPKENTDTNSFQQAIGTFLSSGCCVIDKINVLPPDFVRTCLDRAKSDCAFLHGKMEDERQHLFQNRGVDQKDAATGDFHHRLVALTRQDYAEWVARDGGRVDVRYGLNRHPYNCGGLVYNSIVFPLVRALLHGCEEEEPVQLLYAGIMWGMPVGSQSNGCHQKWHADGGHLFFPDQLPEGLTLPPHCINVFYPLVNLTEENGPTEFRIGSHRRDGHRGSLAEFPLVCPAGGAVLFDYRIQHRGRANLWEPSSMEGSLPDLDHARPVLYLAYAKTYFKDHGNSRSGRRLVPNGTASLWTTRTLEGRPVPYGKGFEDYSLSDVGGNSPKDEETKGETTNARHNNGDTPLTENAPGHSSASEPAVDASVVNTTEASHQGVGERWILFQMTLELPNGGTEVLRVHQGDVAVEVAQQFCFRHGLQDDFVPVLTQTIQGQMNECG